MSTRISVLVWSIVSLSVACDSPTGVPEANPLVEGSVVSFPTANKVYIDPTPADCHGGYVLGITERTKVFVRAQDGTVRRGSASDLVIGQVARAWLDGGDPIDDSCPRATSAGVIELVASASLRN